MHMENLRLKRAVSRTLLLAAFSLSILSLGQATAAPLRYAPKANQKIAYSVEIVGDLPDEIETSKGHIFYVATAAGDPFKLQFSGGLSKTTKRKEGAASNAFPVMRIPGGPFGRMGSRGGLRHTSSQLSLTSRGKTQTMTGESQLPYLLGHLSVLAFEVFPENDQKSWTDTHDVGITQGSSSPFGIPHFPGHGSPKKVTSGNESTSYAFQSEKGDLVTYRKTYRLNYTEDKDTTSVNGSGLWTFNRRLGVPESLDYKFSIITKEPNTTTTIPVTVKYNRLSEEELAKIEREQEEQRKKNEENREKTVAEQKSPIEGEERRRILRELKSRDKHELIMLLSKLSRKEVREDKEIAKAIKPMLKHSDKMVRDRAADAIVKFAPELAQKIKVNKEYSSIHNVNTTGAAVTARTPLPKGLIVAVNEHGPWYKAAKIVSKHKDGEVEVEFVGFNRVKTIHYSKIRLAPPEVDQPFVSKRMLAKLGLDENSYDDGADDDDSSGMDEDEGDSEPDAKSDSGYRTWTDSTGTFAIVAKYVDNDGKNIKLLRKKDGKEIEVPISRLSDADRKVAERLKATPKPDNPFE